MSKFNQHLTTALQALGFSVSDERATADSSVSLFRPRASGPFWLRIGLATGKEVALEINPQQIVQSADRCK